MTISSLPPAASLHEARTVHDSVGRVRVIPSPAERLMSGVSESPDGCWEWNRHRNPAGYGQIGVDGTVVLTHRLAWAVERGEWPPVGLLICHRCDNPPCCNPSHLFAGTHADNTADMVSKGRQVAPKGEQNGRCTISSELVEEIRAASGAGASYKAIAREIGVHPVTVSRICRGLRRSP